MEKKIHNKIKANTVLHSVETSLRLVLFHQHHHQWDWQIISLGRSFWKLVSIFWWIQSIIEPDEIFAKVFFRTPFSSWPRIKVKVSKFTLAFPWPPRFLSERFPPLEKNRSGGLQKNPGSAENVNLIFMNWTVARSRCKLTVKPSVKANYCSQKWLKMRAEQNLSKSWPVLSVMVRCGLEGWVQYDHPPPRMVKDEFSKEIQTNGLGSREAFT